MKKGIVLLLAASFMLMSMFTGEAKAAIKGSIICSHGNIGNAFAGGSISSTEYENNMCVNTMIRVDGGNPYMVSVDEKDTRYTCCYEYLAGKSGSTYCIYWVDSTYVHQSTASFYFDFK